MDSSQSRQHDEYALAILTQAAITHPSSSPTPRPPSYQIPQNSLTASVSIANQHDPRTAQPLPRNSNVTSDILHGYSPASTSSSTMETLVYAPARDMHNPYMTPGYHHSSLSQFHAQMSTSYPNDLGILNAETYDDGRLNMASQGARQQKQRQETSPILPFGMSAPSESRTDDEPRASSHGLEKGTKRKKKKNEDQNDDTEEEARKKARGRPRVDTKDETAADRRRTQIRMAQRAYRHRKETTISSLEKQVTELRGANEEMSNIFISLYDFAVEKGLLKREPEFGHHLQSTTQRFLSLTKAAGNEEGSHDESQHGESANQASPKVKDPLHHVNDSVEPPRQLQRETGRRGNEDVEVQPWGGYTVTKDDSPVEEISREDHQEYDGRSNSKELRSISKSTQSTEGFPFEMMDLQQYRVRIPSPDVFAQSFSPDAQLPLPKTGSMTESSLARRIHRSALEKALQLVTSKNPNPQQYQRIFGMTKMYESKEAIETRIRARLASSSRGTLQNWRAPFVHLGGSGTFYPMHESDINGEFMPKFRTGYSMGPFSPVVAEVQESIHDDMRCSIPGFEGEFFDANDVEGYLRGRGVEIPASADFVTVELDLSVLAEISSPKSHSSGTTTMSANTPTSPVDTILIDDGNVSYYFDFNKPDGKSFTFPSISNYWDNDTQNKEMNTGDVDPMMNNMPDLVYSQKRAIPNNFNAATKRRVVINVQVFIDEILDRGVCLGRAPGFKVEDVNTAIMASIKTDEST